MMRSGRVHAASVSPLALLLLLVCPVHASADAASSATTSTDEYPYAAQARDTLIGLSRRLLKDPRQWRALRMRNGISDPTRIPLGRVIRIPRDWLRQDVGIANVTTVVGSASDASGALKPGQVLAEGDRISTAARGYVTLALPDGSVITLNESSTLALERLVRYQGTGAHDTRLRLESGRVATHVMPQGAAGRFEIRTPVAVSAVRGTEFRRGFQPGSEKDATEVIGGTVAVAGAAGAVVVPTGFGTISDAAGGPRAPVKLLPPPDLTSVPARFDAAQVRVTFAAVPAAVAYRAQLSADQEFRQIVADHIGPGATVEFADIPDGHYWLRARSVDAEGLEGADAAHPFDRRRLPSSPAVQEPLADALLFGSTASFAWTAVPDAASYRLQVARDAVFSDVVATRDGLSTNRLRIEPLTAGTYYWRVASIDADSRAGPWSVAQTFRQKALPGTIGAPIISPTAVDLSWSGEPAQRFLVQLSSDAGFATLIEEAHSETPHARFHRPPGGTYYARFQVVEPDGSAAPFSPSRKFFVPVRWWALATPLSFALLFL